jgi:predicted enzyme related to lactoylglutathione lyase
VAVAAVIYAKDLDRVSAFYESVAGLAVTARQATYVVLSGDGFRLFVVAVPHWLSRDIVIGDPPARREDTPIKLVLPVASLAAAREVAPAYGGVVDPPDREGVFDGTRVCDGHDPEGNVLQLAEQ